MPVPLSLSVLSYNKTLQDQNYIDYVDSVSCLANIFAKLSLNSTQLNFNSKAEIALFSDNTASHPPNHPTGKVVKLSKSSNSLIEDVKYFN